MSLFKQCNYSDKMRLMFTKNIICRAESPLMIRYNIFRSKIISIRIHKFVSSDHDCLHDHPWDFITLILKNGYYEKIERKRHDGYVVMVDGRIQHDKVFRKPFTLLFRKAEFKHSVQLKDNIPSWSFVISFKVRISWGFWRNGNWTLWKLFDSKNTCE